MRAWLERSFRNRIFLTVLLVALVPLLLCDVLMTQMMIFRSEHTLRTDAQEEMALLTTQLDALLTDCGDVTRALAGSTVTRSALRRGGSDSRTLYQLLNRSTVALREYADFEVYGEDGDCLYTTANVWPAALMGALCLVLCLVCAWWLSRRLFEPVNELDGAMRRVEGGDYDVRIESTRQDEMGRLAASFDRMTAEYRQNLERSVQRERELNETRLRMLQSQLNPHFLYNTLDCMKWLGVTGGVPQVAELAADLAALLRAGISGSEYITLEEELELIGRYLAIQEVRFGDRFVCELDVDERFQRCVVPKLILQPLVENAIIHGVADSDEGFIKLWAEEDAEGYLLLKVSDNGSGIPPEVLERLNSHELIPGGHLGLNNVDRIVRLSYGESCGLSAYPNEGGGSCVQLRLPMQKGEDHAQGTDR